MHRDIKPDNIMFDEFGQCVVTDFGIAKAGGGSRLTGTGMSIGTPHYMSPEQARAQSIDGRSDLYSLGVLAYQVLVGEVPYDGEDSFSIGYKHIMEPIPVPLLDTAEERRLFEVIKRLIMKDPLDRFQDAEALLKALEGQPRESVAQRRVTAAQAILSVQSTALLQGQSVALQPPTGPPSPLPSQALPSETGAMAVETPRRPVIRRSAVVEAQPSGNWLLWVLAGLAIVGFAAGASYLYRNGLLGGKPAGDTVPVVPVPETTATARSTDSIIAPDSAALYQDLLRFDSATAVVESAPPKSAPVPVARPGPAALSDSGTLQLSSLPPRTQVFIDTRQVTQPGAGIRLAGGWHELGVSAPGFLFYTDSVYIEPGRTLLVNPSLAATNVPAPPSRLGRRAPAPGTGPARLRQSGPHQPLRRPLLRYPSAAARPDPGCLSGGGGWSAVCRGPECEGLAPGPHHGRADSYPVQRARLHEGRRGARPGCPLDPRDARRPAGRRLDPGLVLPRRPVSSPLIHPTAFIAPSALVMGDVGLGAESSVWYTAVVRGDMAPIRVGSHDQPAGRDRCPR